MSIKKWPFRRVAFYPANQCNLKSFQKSPIGQKKVGPLKSHFVFGHVNRQIYSRFTCSLFTWSKQKWLFWRAGFYPANESNLKSFYKALIGWKKPALQKSHFCFDHANRLIITRIEADFLTRLFFPANLFFHFESFFIFFDWLEKSLDRKLTPIEVIM